MTCCRPRTEIPQKRFIKGEAYVDFRDGLNLTVLLFGGIVRSRAMKKRQKASLFNGFAMAYRKESRDLILFILMKLSKLQKSGTQTLKKNAK